MSESGRPSKYIEKYNIENLIPYVNNSRTHSEEQISQVASSINEFGFTNPVLIDEKGSIIAGHGRTLAAKKLGMDSVPAIELIGLTEAQKKAYVIADNQLALNAGWDLNMLKLELENLKELDFDLDLIGFDGDFLSDLEAIGDNIEESQDIKEEDYKEVYNLIINCDDEIHQEVLYQKLSSEGIKCQVQSL